MKAWDRLPCAWGGPAGRGRIRTRPEDFRVRESMGFEPGGGGEHAWLWVGQRGVNTADVADALARGLGIRPRAVGYSGRKDRHALTWQWFSVQLPGTADPDWAQLGNEHWWIEHSVRHARKLRTGTHRGNRFDLVVRGLQAEQDVLEARLGAIACHGFPNYFGAQRFGGAGENLARARQRIGPDARRRPSGMQISAARSWLFNLVLAARVADGTWDRALAGDAVMLAGSRSIFEYTPDQADVPDRVAAMDLDPTGPLWGEGDLPLGAAARERERAWLSHEAVLREGLERLGARAARRPLRARADGLEWSLSNGLLRLSFALPTGVYATSLLRELVDIEDAAAGGDD